MIDAVTSPLSEPFMVRALLEVVFIGLTAGVLGCWIVLYGLSYASESISHTVFPGLVAAAGLGLPLLAGGVPALAVATLAIALIARIPVLGRDTAVAVAVTGMFGLGGVLAALPPGTPALSEILFGDVLGTTGPDLLVAAALSAAVLALALALHARLLAYGFDPSGARALGLSPARIEVVVLGLVAGAVMVAVQGLGNLLVVAILVAPAATARLLTARAGTMMVIASLIAVAVGAAGLYASFYLGTAAGASIAGIAVASYAVASILTSGAGKDAGARIA